MLIRTIYNHEIVRRRLLNSLLYLLFYFIGLNILIPFVSPEMVNYLDSSNGSLVDILNTINTKSDFVHNVSILALGGSAYYLASVIIFLITPFLYRGSIDKEQSIRRLLKILTLAIATIQAANYSQIVYYWFLGEGPSVYTFGLIWITLVTGALICMWIADKITAQGLLDGRILLMCLALFDHFPSALIAEVSSKVATGKLLQLGVEIVVWALIVAGIIALTQAIRYLPLQMKDGLGGDQLENPTLRVRLNMVDEYSLMLAQQFIGIPALLLPVIAGADTDTQMARLLFTLSDPASPISLLLTFCIIMLATYTVVKLVIKPEKYWAFLKQWNVVPVGITTEDDIRDFFRELFDRLALPLAIALGVIGILPGFAMLIFGLDPTFATYFGGFSLFLIVSLLTDLLSKVEQMTTETSLVMGRSTTPELDLVYELEVEYEEEE